MIPKDDNAILNARKAVKAFEGIQYDKESRDSIDAHRNDFVDFLWNYESLRGTKRRFNADDVETHSLAYSAEKVYRIAQAIASGRTSTEKNILIEILKMKAMSGEELGDQEDYVCRLLEQNSIPEDSNLIDAYYKFSGKRRPKPIQGVAGFDPKTVHYNVEYEKTEESKEKEKKQKEKEEKLKRRQEIEEQAEHPESKPWNPNYDMEEKPYEAHHLEILERGKSWGNDWINLTQHVVDTVKEINSLEARIATQKVSYRPGAGFRADVTYTFPGNKQFKHRVRDDEEMKDTKILEEAFNTLQEILKPMDVFREEDKRDYIKAIVMEK